MAVQKTPKKRKITQDAEEIRKKKIKSKHKMLDEKCEVNENITNNVIAKEAQNIEKKLNNKQKPLKSKKDFKFLEFRKKLRGTNFIADIRDFLQRARKPRFIAKYLEKRGKPLELVEALARINPTNVLQISYICEGLHLMLIEIVSNQKEYLHAAEQACRYLLKAHISAIDKLLNSPQLEHVRLALKLLTSIVCVDAQLARLLLNSCDILSNSHNIDKFLAHNVKELNAAETVRKCYIHLVLAYFIDGNVLLAQSILDRAQVIRALASGLQFDDHVTVCMVINTLRTYVLECAEISKTKKFHVFDQDCCRSLAAVYDWYGPKVFAASSKQKLSKLEMQQMVDKTQQAAVINALHEFLLLLLSTRKNGICFNALKHMDSLDCRQKHNVVPGKVIFGLYKPWKSVQKTELVVKILNACPELGRKTILKFGGVVNFMRTLNPEWVSAVEFLSKLIDTLHPRLLESIVDKSTITDWTYWVKDVCLPMETLVLITKSNVLLSKAYEYRLATARLLHVMFRQYNNYVQRQEQKAKELQRTGTDSLRRFKLELINHILVHFPPMEKLLLSLNLTIELENTATVRNVELRLAHLEACLDVILEICKKNREFVNKTRQILEYLQILRPYYCTENAAGNINVELKAVKTMLALFPKALSPGTDMFQSILISFINAFVSDEAEISSEAKKLLHEIFKNTGFFDANNMEIDLWLEALRFVDKLTVDIVTVVFIEVLQLPKHKVEVNMPKPTDVTNKRNMHELLSNIEQGLSLEAYVEVLKLSPLMWLILKGVEVKPPLSNYLEIVCLLLFHYIPAAADILHIYTQEFEQFTSYMQSWLTAKNAQMLEMLPAEHSQINKIPYLHDLQVAIVQGSNNFDELMQLITQQQDAHILVLHAHMLLFAVTHLSENELLTKAQAQNAATALIACLKAIKDFEEKSLQIADETATHTVNSILSKLLHYIYNIRLAQSSSLQLFGASNEAQHNFVHFICLLTEHCQILPDFANYGCNLRLKLVNGIKKALQNQKQTKQNNQQQMQSLKLVQCLNLNATHSLEMLQLLAEQLKPSDCLTTEHTAIKPSIYYKLIVCLLQQLANFKQAVNCQNFVIKFVNIYKYLIEQPHEELDALELAFYEFLIISPHCISALNSDIFQCFFTTRRLNKSTIKLAALLMQRNIALHDEFLKQLPEQLEKRELIYALLQVAFKQKLNIPMDLLQTVYAAYKKGLLKAIEKPRKAIAMFSEYIDCGLELIRQCMPQSECLDYCQKQLNCDAVEYYQILLLHEIYSKANEQATTKLHVNYLNTLLQLFSQYLKQQQHLHLHKLKLFGFVIYDCLQKAGANADFEQIQQTSHWRNLCKIILKLSLQVVDANLTATEQAEVLQQQSCLLQILALLCEHVYAFEQAQQEAAVQNFEMLISHSQFQQILLQQSASTIKTQVLHLMYVLCKKSTSLLKAHTELIVVLLAAYGARLYAADRYALALLQLFEEHATAEFHAYRPFVWGETAISYYGLRNEAAEQQLTQQEVSIAHIMSLVDKQICENTLENFPIWRKLQTQQQMPQFKFANPAAQVCHLGYSILQQELEHGVAQLDKSLMNLASSKTDSYESCYDPAFFVPLLSMCFEPGQNSHPARPVENGLLALSITALASQDAELRLAAACAQMRYRAHFEQHKFATRELWSQIYDNLQAGLHDLREMRQRNKEHVQTPRVPLYSALYVARSLQLSNNPTHLLYKQLFMHLRERSTFNFQSIPNFNVLFFSRELEHAQFRKFILEIIRHGLKSSGEVALLVMSNTLKVLLSAFGNVFGNLELTCLLLDIINKSVKIPATIKMLVEHVGILSWLHTQSVALKFHQFDVIEGLISIIYNLWYALRASQQYFHNFTFLRMRMHELALHILPHLSTRISISGFSKILRVLQQTHNAEQSKLISEEQLDQLVDCAACHFPEHIHSIESIRKFGANCVESADSYSSQLQAKNISIEAIISLCSLRNYIISWQKVPNIVK